MENYLSDTEARYITVKRVKVIRGETARRARKKMRIRVALAASNHVAALSIYLSSRRKGIHLKFITEKIYTEGKGREQEKRW